MSIFFQGRTKISKAETVNSRFYFLVGTIRKEKVYECCVVGYSRIWKPSTHFQVFMMSSATSGRWLPGSSSRRLRRAPISTSRRLCREKRMTKTRLASSSALNSNQNVIWVAITFRQLRFHHPLKKTSKYNIEGHPLTQLQPPLANSHPLTFNLLSPIILIENIFVRIDETACWWNYLPP